MPALTEELVREEHALAHAIDDIDDVNDSATVPRTFYGEPLFDLVASASVFVRKDSRSIMVAGVKVPIPALGITLSCALWGRAHAKAFSIQAAPPKGLGFDTDEDRKALVRHIEDYANEWPMLAKASRIAVERLNADATGTPSSADSGLRVTGLPALV